MRNLSRYWTAAAVAGLFTQATPAQDAALAAQARTVLRTYCHRCHHGEGSEYGTFDVLLPKTLTTAEGDDKPLLVAGKPAESPLLQKVLKGSMPPKNHPDRPSEADKQILQRWVEAGLPETAAVAVARPFISVKDNLVAVRDHLRAADKRDRPFLRYFTLTHLHNNPSLPDTDMPLYRAALSKAVNSLSFKKRIVIPRPVDKETTVYVIDTRDLDWDKYKVWDAIAQAYPYGLKYSSHPDVDMAKLDDDITEISDCELPLMRADWFVATATRPPLYHKLIFETLLRIPGGSLGEQPAARHVMNARELEVKLGVNVPENFARDRLARAGFPVSGVSGQNRLVERHDSEHGYYWKSYDFKLGTQQGNLAQFPLGPTFHDNPFPRQAFHHDGGEIIFSLPNGLQGYMLVDGKDDRIDVGPVDVVSDSKKTSGLPAIVNGVSCTGCHKDGMIKLPSDTIREGSGVFGEARRKVQRLYPVKKDMDTLVKEDAERFIAALDKATGPFLKVGAAADKPITAFDEPISEVARVYALTDLSVNEVAAELGLEKADEVAGMVKGNKKLRELGLGALGLGGRVKRHDWEAMPGVSLFHRVARELECGTPFRVLK